MSPEICLAETEIPELSATLALLTSDDLGEAIAAGVAATRCLRQRNLQCRDALATLQHTATLWRLSVLASWPPEAPYERRQ